jgi:hypothetical protein
MGEKTFYECLGISKERMGQLFEVARKAVLSSMTAAAKKSDDVMELHEQHPDLSKLEMWAITVVAIDFVGWMWYDTLESMSVNVLKKVKKYDKENNDN